MTVFTSVARVSATTFNGFLLCCALATPGVAHAQQQPTTVWADSGSVLWNRPGPHGQEVARVQTLVELRVSEGVAGWVRVVYLGRSGWLEKPDYGSHLPQQVLSSPCADVDPASGLWCRNLGWVWLLTDLPDGDEVATYQGLLEQLPGRYRQRYGEFELDRAVSWIAIMVEPREYQQFWQRYQSGEGSDHSALAAGRVAAVLVGDSWSATEKAVTHEAVHLLNRVALGDHLPVWLEEGVAGCFGLLSDQGTLEGSTTFSPVLVYHRAGFSEQQTSVTHTGTRAVFARTRESAQRLELDLEPVFAADRSTFYSPLHREHHYELASVVSCYLAEREMAGDRGGIVGANRDRALKRKPTAEASQQLASEVGRWAGSLLRQLETLPSAAALVAEDQEAQEQLD